MNVFFKSILIVAAGLLPAVAVYAQKDSSLWNKKVNRIAIGSAAVYSTSLIGLNALWYKDYEKSSFQSFNDNSEWLQIDKVGHFYSTYTLSKLSYDLYPQKEGEVNKKALMYSGGSAFLFLTTIEVFDGFSKEWGFSWGDFVANTGGIGFFVGQELLFQKQIVQIKYSYLNTGYRRQRPEILGESTLQSAFKDYNGQRYWASFNLNSIHHQIKPQWLSIAIGYGGDQMIFANERDNRNIGLNPNREYYLSLDVDFSKIKTNKEWLRWCFRVANCIKLPAPAIRFSNESSPIYYGLFF